MAKQQFAIIHDGQHIMNVVAGSEMGAIGAAQRKAAKHGLPSINPSYAQAIHLYSRPDIKLAISTACLATVNFQAE